MLISSEHRHLHCYAGGGHLFRRGNCPMGLLSEGGRLSRGICLGVLIRGHLFTHRIFLVVLACLIFSRVFSTCAGLLS